MIVTVFAYLSRYFFNHCFAKADFLIAREHSNFVQLLRPYGRTCAVHEALPTVVCKGGLGYHDFQGKRIAGVYKYLFHFLLPP
jgi:hypothetical protein